MYTVFKFVVLIYIQIKLSNTQNINGSGVCGVKPLKCCAGYRRKGEECEDCFPGTFDTNCKSTCPSGFYGIRCSEKCKCSSCDKITGTCQTNYTDEDDDWTNVILLSCGTTGVCFAVGVLIYYHMRRSRPIKESDCFGEKETQSEVRGSNETSVQHSFSACESNHIDAKKSKNSKLNYLSECHESDESSSSSVKEVQLSFESFIVKQGADNISINSVYNHLNTRDTLPYNEY
ncbi:uncharacterized protein LOC134244226 [Saccostrea cucullata]|uniref:uncharacterized protein LOC134244226 n=1 Tax=Saccostrea cuccullata TaxID=36930 RepID=UPI002ED02B45